ncbi:MAG: NB-ARC domain-containing protein, partial [Chloroflexota bacterium]
MSSPNFKLSPEELNKMIRQELKNYHQIEEPPAAELLKLHVVRNQLETQSQPNAPFAKRLALNTVLHKAIEDTYKENKDYATLLRKRFLDRETIPDVSEFFHISQATVSRWTDKAFEVYCNKFQALEDEAKESWFNRLESRLPSQPYSRLVGVDQLRNRVLTKLTDPNGPGVVALFGIGGIGKSSLADYAARAALRSGHFQNVSWILFRPEQSDWLLVDAKIKQQ